MELSTSQIQSKLRTKYQGFWTHNATGCIYAIFRVTCHGYAKARRVDINGKKLDPGTVDLFYEDLDEHYTKGRIA